MTWSQVEPAVVDDERRQPQPPPPAKGAGSGTSVEDDRSFAGRIKRNGLSIVLIVAFLLIWLVGQTIVLRQYGSPESKPVHAPHSETGS